MNTNKSPLSAMLTSVADSIKNTGARFASVIYTNADGETARHTLVIGARVSSAYKSDLRTLHTLRPALEGIRAIACDELIASLTESLEKGIGNNSKYRLAGYFDSSENGIKTHINKNGENCIYLQSISIKKEIIKPAPEPKKPVNSSAKTLAKKELEKGLKKSRIRTFTIAESSIKRVAVNGYRLEIDASK